MNRIVIMSGVIVSMLMFSGCTSHKIEPVDKEHNLEFVCIENNPKVIVTDYVPAVEDVLHEYGIATSLYTEDTMPEYCAVKMKYTVLRNWDLATYIKYADVHLYKNGARIGYAQYTNGGGFDFDKWGSAKEKMTPVLEKMLAQYEKKEITFDKNKYNKQSSNIKASITEVSIKDKLAEIKKMYEDGLITEEEYSAKRQQLLNDY